LISYSWPAGSHEVKKMKKVNKKLFVGIVLVLFFVFNLGIASADMTTGLVGYWNFEEGSGTIAADSSGNGNDVTLRNGPTWTIGRVGQALNLDGVDDYALKLNPSYNFTGNPTKSFSVSAWFNPRACVSLSGLALADDGTSYSDVLRLATVGEYWIMQLRPGGTHADGGNCALNQWHHLTGVYNAGETKIYLYYNGVLADSKVVSNPSTSGFRDRVNIGFAQEYFDGLIDEVRVYDRALSASDVMEIYNSAGAPPPPDTEPPSTPTNLIATAISYYQVNLSWSAATDDVGVTGYRIYRDGTLIGNSVTTIYLDANAYPSTTYSYTVSAYDGAGNQGSQSSPALAITPAAPRGQTYYVSKTGDDANPGTQAQPWRTIQKAADTVTTGDTVYVNAGIYDEKVFIRASGNPGAMISFIANGNVKSYGFHIVADYVRIKGFNITSVDSGWTTTAYGIFVRGNYCIIEDNYIYYCPNSGICTATASHGCIIRNNKLQRNTLAGMEIDGTNHLIENNEIWDTIVYHTPTQSMLTQDSNGAFYHGSGHIFRGNYIHNITFTHPEAQGYHPHIDAFQTFSGAQNVLFEKNLIVMPEYVDEPGNSLAGWMLARATNITIRNNIVVIHRGTETGGGGCSHLKVMNNVFVGSLNYTGGWPGGVMLERAPNSIVRNNIIFNQVNQAIYLTGTTFDGLDIGNNLVYNSDGSTPSAYTYTNWSSDLWGVNPLFVDPDNGDYHLQAGSPAIDAGYDLTGMVTDDYEGNPRPQGAGYDIGAYETSSGPPQYCSDGTLYAQCSSTLPLYCNNGVLEDKCSKCNCPANYTCLVNESCRVPITGDLNNDGVVDIQDITIVATNFGLTAGFDNRADTDSNNIIDIFDVVFVASRFT